MTVSGESLTLPGELADCSEREPARSELCIAQPPLYAVKERSVIHYPYTDLSVAA